MIYYHAIRPASLSPDAQPDPPSSALGEPLDQLATAAEAIAKDPHISAHENNASSTPSAEAITTRPFEDTPQLLEEIVVDSEPLKRTIGHLARPVEVPEDRELREQMAPTIGATLSQ